ncbi:unnamed protein product [Linum tenue]|uniref:TF-B3 domain-containing protein n=1 Tax=Linum tenue TaxID=586396 RepID=A0AAV0RDA9_9ROSI|nr:unnamed protein product [Linum tenue]
MSNQTPSFVKVLAGCSSMKLLRIPESFINQFGQGLYGKVIFKSNTGNPAVISVERGSKGYFFGTGWPSFVKDNGLHEGDHLVFNFTGHRTVEVVSYDPTGCVKRNAEAQSNEPCPSPARNQETEPSSKKPRNGMGKEGRREVQPQRPRRSTGRSLGTEQLPKTRKGVAKGSESRPREAPIKTESEDGYSFGNAPRGLAACFQVVYKKYMNHSVCIPLRLCKIARLEMKNSAQLQDPSGKVWPVTIISGGKGTMKRFGGGWLAFAAANGVAVGDRIEFRYKSESGVFQVMIHNPKNNTCNDSRVGKRQWKRADAANPERKKPRLQRKRGAPTKAKSRKGHSSGNNAPPGLADSFQVVYNKHMERSTYMCMPVRFSEATKLSLKKTVQLQDPSGKLWAVSVISGGKGLQRRFSAGWRALAAANRVAVGDRIEFSYRPESGLIQVKIHRERCNAGKDPQVGRKRPWKRSGFCRS